MNSSVKKIITGVGILLVILGIVSFSACKEKTSTKSQIKECTVRWMNGDELLSADSVKKGKIPVFTGAIPKKSSDDENVYVFKGWSPTVAAVTDDVIYHAVFSSQEAATVTWKNGDTEVLKEKVAVGTIPKFNGVTPVKESTEAYSYNFTGWSPAVSTLTTDITFVAQFSEKKRTYWVTFNDDKHKVQIPVKFGDHAITPSWKKDGYALSWKNEKGIYNTNCAVSSDISVFAVWTARTDTPYNVMVFKENSDGTFPRKPEVLTLSGTTGSEVTLTDAILGSTVPKGYKIDSSRGKLTGKIIAGENSLALTVYLQRETYMVSFLKTDGSELYLEKVKYGDASKYRGVPDGMSDSQNCYIFSKWVTEKNGVTEADLSSVTSDISVYASYEVLPYAGKYASFATENDIEKNTAKWLKTCALSTDKQYNGTNTLKVSLDANSGGRIGVVLDSKKLSALLAVEGAKSVNIYFRYNASGVSGEPNYISMGCSADNAAKISRDNAWCYYSATFESVPENFIIGAFYDINCSFVSHTIVGDLYISDIYYTVNFDIPESGTYYEWNNDTVNATADWGGNGMLETGKQHNGKNTLCITPNGGNSSGVYISPIYLNYLLKKDDVESVTVSFDYDISGLSGGGAGYIGYGASSDCASVVNRTAGWHTWSYTFTNKLSATLGILGVGNSPALGWANSTTSGKYYVSELTYKINYKTSEPSDGDSPTDENTVYAAFKNNIDLNNNTSDWIGIRSISVNKKFDNSNTLNVTQNTNNGGRMGVVLSKEKLTKLLALDGAISVTLSFNYNAGAVEGTPNFINLGLIDTKAMPVVKTDSWNTYSATFDSVPENFILSVSNLANSGYSGSSVTGTLYIGNITYIVNYSTGVYASFATDEEVNANTKNWLGARSSSEAKQYNGKNSLKITNSATGGRFGCIIDKENLKKLLALNGVKSVTLSFNYNASAVTGAPNYISLGLIDTKAMPIVKTDSWNTYSATFDSVPENFILSVSNLKNSGYSGYGVTGALYVGDITYIVNYSTGVYASFATDEEVNANTKIWLGTRSSSDVKQYNGKNSLSINNTAAGGRFGCVVNKEKLAELLALDGVESVTISFDYNASVVDGKPYYISLGLIEDKAMSIVKTDSWNTYSATFDSVPENFILSVSNLKNSGYSGYGVTGTLHVGRIIYTINFASK